MGACPPPKEHSDSLSLSSPSPSIGAWDPGESGKSSFTFCVWCCPSVPSSAVSTSSPVVFTYSVKQVQPPDHCNVYTHTQESSYSCAVQLPPFTSLGCPSWRVHSPFLPSDSSAPFPHFSSFHSLCSLPLSTPCDVLIWGTGHPLCLAPC